MLEDLFPHEFGFPLCSSVSSVVDEVPAVKNKKTAALEAAVNSPRMTGNATP
jgi:hypothetical protein